MPTGKPEASVPTKLLELGALPGGGPVTSQPPRSPSNDVDVPSGRVMSSTKTPRFWVPQSLTYAMEISTVPPAHCERSTLHSCQPLELPLAACHSPVVPVDVQFPAPSDVW